MAVLRAALALVVVLAATQPSPPPTSHETAAIRGHVTDRTSGAALAGAIVRLVFISGGYAVGRTDGDGAYIFKNLAAGRYRVVAEPGELTATHLAAMYGDGENGRDVVVLAEGEMRSNVDVAMPRAYAIAGRVVDDLGEPAARVQVEALQAGDGRHAGAERLTDDLGTFRIFGLTAGQYVVCAKPAYDLSRRGTQAEEHAIRTCHPSDAGAPLVVKTSDVEGVEVRLLRSKTFSVAGTMLDARGLPAASATLWITRFDGRGSMSSEVAPGAEGRFRVAHLIPGQYLITAAVGANGFGPGSAPLEAATVPIDIGVEDVDGLVVAMTKTVSVAGRFVVADGPPLTPSIARSIWLQARQEGLPVPSFSGDTSNPSVQTDLTFQIEHLYGRRRLVIPEAIPNYVVKAITYNGQDILDKAIEFGANADPNALQIVLTTRGAVVSGAVADDSGSLARARVMMIPTDRRRWPSIDSVESSIFPATGQFRLRPQRPGEYAIVAVADSDPLPEWQGPGFFERVVQAGQTITLTENDRRTVDLRISKLPESR
jgi:Carboxypeptidase regulatory-like domain